MAEQALVLARRHADRLRPASRSGSRPGSAIAAARRRRSGSPTWPTRAIDEGAARQLERLQPDVGRRHGLLPLRPRRAGDPVRVRHATTKQVHRGDRRTTASTSSRRPPARARSSSSSSASLKLFDTRDAPGEARSPSTVAGDLPERAAAVREGGREAAFTTPASRRPARAPSFEARGEILTVPAEKGDVRNLTHTPGVAERDPGVVAGRQVDRLFLRRVRRVRAAHPRPGRHGRGEEDRARQRRRSSTRRVWSPDSKKIAYTDKRLNLWYVDVATRHAGEGRRRLLREARRSASTWSPDSKWIAYTQQLTNHLHAVFVYSLESEEATRSPTA